MRLVYTGEWITKAARALEEQEEGEGAAMLRKTLVGVQKSQILDLLAGKLELKGDSEKGVEFIDVRHMPGTPL